MRKYQTVIESDGPVNLMQVTYCGPDGTPRVTECEYEDYSGSEAQSVSMMDRANDEYQPDDWYVQESLHGSDYVKDDGYAWVDGREVRISPAANYAAPIRIQKDRDHNLFLDEDGKVGIFKSSTGTYIRGAGNCRIQVCEYPEGWLAVCNCGGFKFRAARKVYLENGAHGPLTYEDASSNVLALSKATAVHAAQAYQTSVAPRYEVERDF